MSAALSTATVLAVFTQLFAPRWFAPWQKPTPPPPRPKPRRGRKGEKKRRKKPPASPRLRGFYERIFSLRLTLWYLIFQRLNFDGTLAGVVADLRAGGADRLGRRRGPKLSRQVRSTKTGAYNQARQRLPLALLQAALAELAATLSRLVGDEPAPARPPAPDRRRRQLLDGSTLEMLPTAALAEAFPQARNQHGVSDWCVMRILVGFCAKSGAVLSACCGPVSYSEQAMAWSLLECGTKFTVWIGDRNFGVWSVVAQARRCHQDAVVRLTKVRARRLYRSRPMASGEDRPIDWMPTRHDQSPPGLAREAVSGRLIYVRLKKAGCTIDLWLFTTLPAGEYPVALLVQWYGQRWQAELHFRSVKTQLQMTELDVRSPQMARKEFYAGLLAYSLVRAVMWAAGERLEQGIKAISFSQARRVVVSRLAEWGRRYRSGAGTAQRWVRLLLAEVTQQTLPKRRRKRPTEMRRVRHRQQKFPYFRGSRAAARARDLATKSM